MSGEKEKKRVILDIEPRTQWENGHGFCGETTLQSIGLYYGCWISQQLIRSINEGELLITDDGNDADTLETLLFEFEKWNFKQEAQPQFQRHCMWLKKHLVQRHPCIIAVYIADTEEKDDDYDHIMPAIGIQYSESDDKYDPQDVLLFYNLFDLKLLERQLGTNDMVKTRRTCKNTADTGGCLPQQINYGYAISGIKDEQKTTVPVRLKVSMSHEPNLSTGASPVIMQGTIAVFTLVHGRNYAILRYNSYKQVPESGDNEAFLRSNYHSRHEFRAESDTYSYADPEGIPSNGSTYYRCVPI
ncbi:unnamed protein product [Rotaria magnacalcarata]|uniref:Uncharacterized protein n=1 Tax=Rotaria magnacalcarata TaxID=392030 RepID=A0A816R7Z7_9BILA|nr:unnamed protein product [Rotaria magnacalcarata]CAF1528704.1 unnamed protein product [Rotaria magnacalcarata]CAF2069332.1 unnamed protein product [Rotaria magnacalcarata]CAF2152215.1 unnamed protein product [Rotaria magnacalcarata]CAF3850291.1 unnamed protein product [Rotaria magnacalcarata]